MKMKFNDILAGLILTAATGAAAFAQSAPPPGTASTTGQPGVQAGGSSTAPGKLTPVTAIHARVKVATDVPLGAPRLIDLGNLSVPGATKDLTSGVTVKAYTRYVNFEGRKIGQIVLSGVAKNGRIEALPQTGFNAQFDLAAPRLEPGHDILVEGDGASLIDALRKLAKDQPTTDKKETKVTQDTPAVQKQSGGTAPKENSQAAAWKVPDAVKAAPKDSVHVTTDGCPIRIDIAGLKAIQQNKTETLKDGAVVSTSDCSDSATTYPLEKSYTVCTDNVDMKALTATAQYILFYTDGGGARKDVTKCTPDTEKVFPIVEKATSCSIYLDYKKLQAVPQSALVYMNDNNREVQVRGCQASASKPAVTMTATTNGCTIRHDFAAQKSYQQGTYTYLMDGISYQAGGCTDNGTIYPEVKTFEDSTGAYICKPVVDMAGGTVTPQSRVGITVNGVVQYVTDCAPDTTANVAIKSTTDGCMDPSKWVHDIAAGQSYGQERFYYNHNGKPEYVTACQTSKTVYPQQVDITGYQNHDDKLFSYPLTTVWITTPLGRYDIKISQVLAGAAQIPYQLTGTVDKANGTASYTGCDKYANTDKFEAYTRPDGTTYDKPVGPGAPVGPTYDCVRQGGTSVADWTPTGSNTYTCGPLISSVSKHGYYTATQKIVRGDGKVISSTTAVKLGSGYSTYTMPSGYESSSCSSTHGCNMNDSISCVSLYARPWYYNQYPSYLPPSYNSGNPPKSPKAADVASWIAALGWN